MIQIVLVATLVAATCLMAVFAPSAITWSAGLAATLVGGVALAATSARHSTRCPEASAASDAWNRAGWLHFTMLLLLVLSVLPVPLMLSRLTGGERYAQNRLVAGALREAVALDLIPPGSPAFAFSRNSPGTCRLIVLLGTACAFAAASALLNRRSAAALAGFLVLGGALTAAAGIVALSLHPQGFTVWWWIPVPHEWPGPVAGFINRNHYGGFAALLTPPAVSLAAMALRSRRWLGATVWLICAGLLLAGVAASLSRGAWVALAGSALAMVAALLARRRFVPAAALLAAIVCAAAVGLPRLADAPALRERALSLRDPARTASGAYRLSMWRDALRIWRAHPVLGCGGFAFRTVYPQYRTTSDRSTATHAENVYVQTLADTGLLGAALLAATLWAWRGAWRSRRGADGEMSALRAGVAGTVAVAAIHACVDSPLHVPLYTATLAALAGAVVANDAAPVRGGTRAALAAATLCCAALGLLLAGWTRADALAFHRTADAARTGRALAGAPTSWMHWYYLGRQACLLRTPQSQSLGERCLSRAGACDPNNYPLWLAIGKWRLQRGDLAGAREAFSRVRSLRNWVPLPPVPPAPTEDSAP